MGIAALGFAGLGEVARDITGQDTGSLIGAEANTLQQEIETTQSLVRTYGGAELAELTGAAGPGSIGAIVQDINTYLQDPDTNVNLANAVWASAIDTGDAGRAGNMLHYCAMALWYQLTSGSGFRLIYAPNFLFFGSGTVGDYTDSSQADLRDIYPSARLEDETDLEMCQRIHPELTWTDTFAPDFIGTFTPNTFGIYGLYLYSPPVPADVLTKKDIMYTPSSGEPKRNSLKDLVTMLAMLPVQWGQPTE